MLFFLIWYKNSIPYKTIERKKKQSQFEFNQNFTLEKKRAINPESRPVTEFNHNKRNLFRFSSRQDISEPTLEALPVNFS